MAEPMIRQFGPGGIGGYVFMGRGELASVASSPSLLPVAATYDRNLYRALELIDLVYEVEKRREQLVLSTVVIAIMTAYEGLTDGLLDALQNASLASEPKGRPNLWERRAHLLKALGLPETYHPTGLRYLYAFRNCLVHNGGLVDTEFLTNIQKLGPLPKHFPNYKIGQPVLLDTEMATSCADTLQHFALHILRKAQELVDRSL